MSQATNIQRYPIGPAVIEEARRLGDRHADRFRGLDLRVLVEEGEPWFVARDACSALMIVNVSDAMGRLDEDERKTDKLSVVTGDPSDDLRKVNLISEAGLYSLIMSSRVPAARVFKRWVTHDVLPAIRNTGRYVEPAAPKTRVELARELLAAEERAEEAERTAAEQRELLGRAHGMLKAVEPKVEAYDALQATDRDWCMRDASSILNRDPFIWKNLRLGQNVLFKLLREMGMVDNANHVYAHHKQHLRLLPTTYQHPHTGEPRASEQLRVTPLGLVYLQKRLGGGKPDALQLDKPNVSLPV